MGNGTKSRKRMDGEGKYEIVAWLSASAKSREGRYIQVGNSFLFDKNVKALSAGARWLYLSMAMESAGKRTFTYTHHAAKKYGIASTSFERYLKELKDGGFIEKVENEDLAQYAPGKYSFSFRWKGVQKTLPQHPPG